jgi:hypothetical protein
MPSRFVLALVQLVVGWFAAPYAVAYVPGLGALSLFALRGIRTPSRETLFASLVGALIGAAAITFVVAVVPGFLVLLPSIPARTYPLIGAILGYLAR